MAGLLLVDLIKSLPTDIFFTKDDCRLNGEKIEIADQNFRKRLIRADESIRQKQHKVNGRLLTKYFITKARKLELIELVESQAKEANKARGMGMTKEIRLISPTGEKVTIVNGAKFCRDNNMDKSAFHKMVHGEKTRDTHLGWSLDKSKVKSKKKPLANFVMTESLQMFVNVLKA